MIRRKIFINPIEETKWLNSLGDTLKLAKKGFLSYTFEKTDTPVRYEYIFLKKQKRSLEDLKPYINSNAKIFKLTSNFALYEIDRDLYGSGILSDKQKKDNNSELKSYFTSLATVYLACGTCFAIGILNASYLSLFSILLYIVSALYFKVSSSIKKED